MLPFKLSEYKERINRTKEKMQVDGIEVLLITDPANMNYLTGYDGWSFYVHQVLIIIIDEDQPIWIGRSMDANLARYSTWLDHNNIIPYPDDYVMNSIKHPMDFVANILNEIGHANRFVGVEMDNYYFTAQCYVQLQKGLPDALIKDANLLVNRVRIIKSDQEIEYMKRAAQIAEQAMQSAFNTIDVNIRECDVAANIYHAQIKGTNEHGGDYPSIVPLLPAGEKTFTPHLTWSEEKYKAGDAVSIELAGCYRRYHAPLARTMVLGKPPAKLYDLANVVLEGMEETLSSIQPGMTCDEVESIWRKTIESRGYSKEDRIGYSVGLNYPPDWGEHTASIRQGDMTHLEPNMTFHMIPGIWTNEFGVTFSETFRVTETGSELFAEFPRELFVKE